MSFLGGRGRSSFFMTYPFGALKTDLEQAFRLASVVGSEDAQKQEPAELSETERSIVLLEHPCV